MRKHSVRIFVATVLLVPSARADLWNVDFGAGTETLKIGFAATGITASDYWNFYTRDDGFGGWKVDGYLANLKNAGAVTTGVGITVNYGDGAWGYGSSDPMLSSYIYSLSGGTYQTIVTVTNLPAGNYNFYLYGADSHFNLQVGANDYGTKISYDNPVLDPPAWMEGHQYVRYANVSVGASDSVVITPGVGVDYIQGIIGGMQIESVPEPSCAALLCLAGLLVGRKIRQP